tara:strand:- start:8885 stop:9052 length:168 start_codon:yes stop_codon:yes gene_type:complete
VNINGRNKIGDALSVKLTPELKEILNQYLEKKGTMIFCFQRIMMVARLNMTNKRP